MGLEGFLVGGGVFFVLDVVLVIPLVVLVVLMFLLILTLTHVVLELWEVLKYW